jgi:DNA polymerase III delta prime subunit
MLSSLVFAQSAMSLAQSSLQREINVWLCDFCKEAFFHDYDDACQHEEICKKQYVEDGVTQENLTVLSSDKASKRIAVQTLFAPILPKSRSLLTNRDPPSSKVVDLAPIFVDPRDGKESVSKCKQKNKSLLQTKAEDKKVSANNKRKKYDMKQFKAPKRSCFDSPSFKNERREFFSKLPVAPTFATKSTMSDDRIEITADIDQETDKTPEIRRKVAPSKVTKVNNYDRFPASSHVGVPPCSKVPMESPYCKELSILRKSLPFSYKYKQRNVNFESSYPLRGPTIIPEIDVTHKILSSILADVTREKYNDQYLWTDKYDIHNIPSDVCGASNKTIAEKCIKFVSDWKAKRSDVRERRALRQDRLARGKKLSVAKRKKDVWDDEGLDEDQVDLPSVCLLTGPMGCGKTSLVHAVAKHCDCKVMEINTSEKRSNQSLRNAIQEATQSESTFDLLKHKASDMTHSHELVDSDGEIEPKGSSVPIILIDEVDLLFENEGDSGFWAALKSLSRKAKCPIFLTANNIPHALSAMSIPFVQFCIVRSTPEECVSKLWQIIKSENLKRRQNVNIEQTKHALVAYASLLDCDIRRMILDLQLFCKSSDIQAAGDIQTPFLDMVPLPKGGIKHSSDEPQITKANPTLFPVDDLLTLEGENLGCLENCCVVTIGNHSCETICVKNSSIQVHCPQLSSWKSSDSPCTSKFSQRFPRIRIKTKPTFPQLISGIEYHNFQLGDGTCILETSQTTLEYPLVSSKGAFNFESDEEAQLANESVSRNTSVLISDDDTFSACSRSVLMEKWIANAETTQDCEDLEKLSKMLALKSDSVCIRDSMASLPILAGACRGFGTYFIDDFTSIYDSVDTKRISQIRAPPIERIILQGWNEDGCVFGSSDTFVTIPCNRERRLLSNVGTLSHASFSLTTVTSNNESIMYRNEEIQDQDNLLSDDFSLLQTFSSALLSDISTHLDHLLCKPSWPVSYELRKNLLRRHRTIEHVGDFFNEIFDESNQCIMFPCSAKRIAQADGETCCQIFLDYSPLLSKICLYETDAMSSIEAPISDSISSDKRNTRRTRLKHFRLYLSNINRMLTQEDCLELGHVQSNFVLRW